MKLLLIIAAIVGSTSGQGCSSSFKSYLDCIAVTTATASSGRNLQTEFGNDFVTLAKRSFDASRAGSSNQRCVLSESELLQTDVFGDSGPLHGCGECQKIARDLRQKFFDVNVQTSKCLRTKLAEGVVDELQPCISGKVGDPNFRIPPLPDFDANSEGYKQLILDDISHRIMVNSRLFFCRSANADRADKTEKALANKAGLFKQHCALDSTCSNTVTSSCKADFGKAKTATCQCMAEKRNLWHDKFDKVQSAIENFDSASACSSSIKEAVGVWRYKLQNALKACLDPKDNILASIGIDKAIDQACNDIEKADSQKRQQIVTGIRMIRNLLDGINDRTTRFCDIQC